MLRNPPAALLVLLSAAAPATQEPPGDPTEAEVPLPAAEGWHARLVHQGEAGIWTVASLQIFGQYGCPELVGLDDDGRCIVLVSYSGKWTPNITVEDGQWLGPVVLCDLDPRAPGAELYTGGKSGNLYQVLPRWGPEFDSREIAHYPGEEVHTAVASDLLPERPGTELVVFTRKGALFEVRPADGEGFTSRRIADLGGRVRDAVLLPAPPGRRPWIATAARARRVELLRLDGGGGLERRTLLEEDMGFGRIARRRTAPGEPRVLYVTRDDGLILRLQEGSEGWQREVVYAGPQGPRGIAAGTFHADGREAVAVFGYSKKVQIVSRTAEGWQVETVFTDVDKGHWLTACEVDGRNATDELAGSGYGKRIFLLARPPGYGLEAVPTDPTPPPEPGRERVRRRRAAGTPGSSVDAGAWIRG